MIFTLKPVLATLRLLEAAHVGGNPQIRTILAGSGQGFKEIAGLVARVARAGNAESTRAFEERLRRLRL